MGTRASRKTLSVGAERVGVLSCPAIHRLCDLGKSLPLIISTHLPGGCEDSLRELVWLRNMYYIPAELGLFLPFLMPPWDIQP